MEAIANFKIWKTIKLGTGIKDADGFRKTIMAEGMTIEDSANDVFKKKKPKFKIATGKIEVDLVIVTGIELGFDEIPALPRSQIYERALELGLDKCPNEVGFQLRLQYKNQPLDEYLLIGMDPITILSDAFGVILVVTRDSNGVYLAGECDYPDAVYDPERSWVFVRPRGN